MREVVKFLCPPDNPVRRLVRCVRRFLIHIFGLSKEILRLVFAAIFCSTCISVLRLPANSTTSTSDAIQHFEDQLSLNFVGRFCPVLFKNNTIKCCIRSNADERGGSNVTVGNIPIHVYCDIQNNEYAPVLEHPSGAYVMRDFRVHNNSVT